MCPQDCHLRSDPEDQDQPTLAYTLQSSTQAAQRTPNTHRPRPHASQMSSSPNMKCVRDKGGGLRGETKGDEDVSKPDL